MIGATLAPLRQVLRDKVTRKLGLVRGGSLRLFAWSGHNSPAVCGNGIAVGYALVMADRYTEARALLKRVLAEAVDFASPGSIMDAIVLLAAVRMEADVAAATRLLA